MAGREPDATDKQLILARERNTELSELVNKFVLRRTNTILSKHLPPKVVEVVCCRLSPLQSQLYQVRVSWYFTKSKASLFADCPPVATVHYIQHNHDCLPIHGTCILKTDPFFVHNRSTF